MPAAATLPGALVGKDMEDCTVEGSSVRNGKPALIDGGVAFDCGVARPIRGKTAKVVPSVARCSLHALAPFQIACRDSFAPCRKKSRTMPASAAAPARPAASPRAEIGRAHV